MPLFQNDHHFSEADYGQNITKKIWMLCFQYIDLVSYNSAFSSGLDKQENIWFRQQHFFSLFLISFMI